MGTDIELIVEVKNEDTWSVVLSPEGWGSDDLEVVKRPLNSWESYRRHWFSDRNYELFAWLADVRNDHDVTPLDETRDIPDDSPAETYKELHGYDSCSYFTVAELQAGLLTHTTKHGGAVNEQVYLTWKASGEPFPTEWCKSSSAPNISEQRYKNGARPQVCGPLEWAGFTIECEWELPATVSFARFAKLLAYLATLSPDPANVRVVFGFG